MPTRMDLKPLNSQQQEGILLHQEANFLAPVIICWLGNFSLEYTEGCHSNYVKTLT